MKFRVIIFILIFAWLLPLTAGEHKDRPFYEMTNQQIDSVLRAVSKMPLTITEKMNLFSARFLGTPYNLTCVGDGPYALLENWPLVNFKELNCMSFCEHVLALSISDYWDNFFDNLQQIRYRDGLIGMKTRNHYTMADWLPQNNWILQDVTRKVGGEFTKQVTRTISHRKFFAGKGITDTTDVLPDRTITLDYIPSDKLTEVKDKTRTGDICAVIYADKTDIFSAHMIMIMESNGEKVIRESTSRGMSTFDTPYDQWVELINTKYKKRYIGLSVMRVRDELNTPGRIIKPWEIPTLKKQVSQ